MCNKFKVPSFAIFFILLFSISVFNCQDSSAKTEALHIAYLSENCSACHALLPGNNQSAPTILEIKEIYSKSVSDESNFLVKVKTYLTEPKAEHSLNAEWVEKYGVMPKMNFSEKRLNASLAYLYSKDWGSLQWQSRNKHLLNDPKALSKVLYDDMSPLEIAQSAAMKTKSALGSQLLQAIKEKGTEGAVGFCKIEAIPITERMSYELKLDIRRVSDRPRNPANRANQNELLMIKNYKEKVLIKAKLEPTVINEPSQTISYFPIETNEMCLQCHGIKGQNLKTNVFKAIVSAYPSDEATGYQSGEIRGLFRVIQKK